jgi:hypothetical protein
MGSVVCEPEAAAAPDVDADAEGGVGKGLSVVILGGFYLLFLEEERRRRKDICEKKGECGWLFGLSEEGQGRRGSRDPLLLYPRTHPSSLRFLSPREKNASE